MTKPRPKGSQKEPPGRKSLAQSSDRTKSNRSPKVRRLPLVDLLVDTRTELLELAIRSGLSASATMLEEDPIAICGPRHAHEPDREASRAGFVSSEVVLGGRKVSVQRPRLRAGGREVAPPTLQTMAATDPLHRRAVEAKRTA